MGDYVRWSPPYYEGADRAARSALFLALNRGKRSIRIDLKRPGGKEVLLRLARDADVLLESFRPGVLDRLGVGYERLRGENPAPRLLRDHRLRPGRPEPRPLRPRHELPRPERAARADRRGRRPAGPGRRPDRRPRRRRADGRDRVLVALRERERSGEGQLVDCSMFDGSLSWLAMVAAECSPAGRRRGAASSQLAGGADLLPALRLRRRLRDARRARAEVLAGVLPRRRARRTSSTTPSTRPGSEAHARGVRDLRRAHARAVAARSPPSTTAAWSRCWASTRRWTPSWSPRGRWSSSSPSPGPSGRCGCSGLPVKLSRTPGDPTRAPRAGAGRAHRRGAGRAPALERRDRRAARDRSRRRASRTRSRRHFHGVMAAPAPTGC